MHRSSRVSVYADALCARFTQEAEARQLRKQKRQPRPDNAAEVPADGTVLPNAPRPRGAGRGRAQQQRQPTAMMQPAGVQGVGYPPGMPHPGMAYGGQFPMAYGPMGAMPWPGLAQGQVPYPPGAWGVPMGWTPAWPQPYPGPGLWGYPPQPPQ